jgi:hydroxypyruvate isomerase
MNTTEQSLLETISEQLLVISKQQADTQMLLKQLLETLNQPATTSLIDDIAALVEPLSKQQMLNLLLSLIEAQKPA